MKKKLIILTEAGISSESGIQTFRDDWVSADKNIMKILYL